MVIYDLICSNFHSFEGWFKDSEDFKAQQAAGLVTCPVCDDANVKMKPSKIAISGKKSNQISKNDVSNNLERKSNTVRDDSSGVKSQQGAAMHFNSPEEQMTVLRDFIETNFEDVGNKFTEEVRKMHYGETDQRGIRGQASKEEVESLAEEGIDTYTIPVASVDKNKLN